MQRQDLEASVERVGNAPAGIESRLARALDDPSVGGERRGAALPAAKEGSKHAR